MGKNKSPSEGVKISLEDIMKNVNAIDKIIAHYAMQDFERMNKLPNGRYRKKYVPYSLSGDTMEARQIKLDYLAGVITEEEYKAYCLRFNLLKRS